MLAVGELLTRYILPRFSPPKADATMPGDTPPKQTDIHRSLSGLRGLIEMAQSAGAKVIVAQYLEKKEVGAARLAGHEMIRQAATDAGATVIQLADAQEASVRAGRDPFRDGLHPNAIGQQVLADALLEPILGSQSVDTSGTRR
jgi:hypothetical protein